MDLQHELGNHRAGEADVLITIRAKLDEFHGERP